MGVGFGYYAYYQGPPEMFSDIFNNNIFTLERVEVITSSADEIISYAGELNGAYPNRLRYGTGVYNSNADNVGSAVGRQGPDVMSTRLWFAKE